MELYALELPSITNFYGPKLNNQISGNDSLFMLKNSKKYSQISTETSLGNVFVCHSWWRAEIFHPPCVLLFTHRLVYRLASNFHHVCLRQREQNTTQREPLSSNVACRGERSHRCQGAVSRGADIKDTFWRVVLTLIYPGWSCNLFTGNVHPQPPVSLTLTVTR